ncbi:LpqB family beta-propeller domain-containing protein [Plantactinospora solaniradicis]|uniref:LpqB family beta-propeller domain-containing protein n=1 Tax=Plantactinospora solaniradicis TaxID=1723736 RepID=A0ABW1K299_9ACTN
MRRFQAAILAGVVLLASGLTACGIPDETDVRVHGRGPVADTLPADGPGAAPPPGRTASGMEPEKFARNFLTAAAGEAGEAYKRVNEYIVPQKRFPKSGNEDVNIVRMLFRAPRIIPNSDGTSTVKIEVQPVGVLRANGSIGEPDDTEVTYNFTIGTVPTDPGSAEGLWVLKPPPVLLMDVEALANYYEEHTIYFWNQDGDALVPDLRYLPRAVPVQRRATQVLDWLIGGPSDWLNSGVTRLPDGTGVVGNVPAPKEGGRLEVNLSVKAGELETDADLKKLYKQIIWSLRTNPPLGDELELKIQNQSKMTMVAADYLRDNPIYQISGPPARYGVLAGSLYPLLNSGEGQPVPVPIAAEANQNIVSAGLSRNGEQISAALVTKNGNSLRLRVGAGLGVVGTFDTGSTSYGSMGRPVWLKDSLDDGPTGLVVADGKLWEFSNDDAALKQVPLAGVSGQVTAVGASLDGRRIAFVAGGRLYVATVRPVDGTLTVASVRQLATSLKAPSAVDWFGEYSLVVAGLEQEDGRAAVFRLSVDGAGESPQVTGVGALITELAAYPYDLEPQASPPLVYESNLVAYAAGTPITRNQVSLGPGTPPPGTTAPTAPFYLY